MTLLQKTCALLPAAPLLLVYALLETPVPISNVYCCISNDQPNALRPLSFTPCIFFAPPTGRSRSSSAPFMGGRGSSSVFRISEMAYGRGITIFYRSCDWFLSGNLKRRSWRNQWRGRDDRFFCWTYLEKLTAVLCLEAWGEKSQILIANYNFLDAFYNYQYSFHFSIIMHISNNQKNYRNIQK